MIQIQLFTTEFLNLLRRGLNHSTVVGPGGTHLNNGSGPKVYDHEVPGDAASHYYLLQQVPGGGYSGPPLSDSVADAAVVFQVDAVGSRRDQAQYMGDQAFAVVMAQAGGGPGYQYALNLPVGWSVCARLASDTPPGVLRDPSAITPLYSVPQRFTVVFTPA